MQTNYLSHFLLISRVIEDLAKAPEPRCILVGSVTGNDNTVGGGGVYPIADLKELDGLKLGAKNPISMFDGYNFDGAKAYKDSKLCLMMTSNTLHDKYHKQTGIAFSSIYPGCLAESPLFREKRPWFRKNFPIFMKYITGGFVSEEEAGQRLFQVAHDPRCSKSGVYWSWNGGPREGRGAEALEKDGQILGGGGGGGGWDSIYENDQSDKVLNKELGLDLFKYSSIVTDAKWPVPNQPKSPCPTLKVVGAVTQALNAKQEAKRMEAQPGMVGGLSAKIKSGAVSLTDRMVVSTVGAGVSKVQALLLGELPNDAIHGSYQEEKKQKKPKVTGRKRAWVKAKAKGLVRFVLRRPDPEMVLAEQAAARKEADKEAEEDQLLELQYEKLPAKDLGELEQEAGHHTGSTTTLTRAGTEAKQRRTETLKRSDSKELVNA
jgi:hypothetical protein